MEHFQKPLLKHYGILRFDAVFLHSLISLLYSVIQALEVTVWRDGNEYTQKYSRGKPVTTLLCHELPTELKDRQGTCIRFWPDKEG